MANKADGQIQASLRHQNSKALNSVPKEAETEAGTIDLITSNSPKTATWWQPTEWINQYSEESVR